jgi:hypothetical protein
MIYFLNLATEIFIATFRKGANVGEAQSCGLDKGEGLAISKAT